MCSSDLNWINSILSIQVVDLDHLKAKKNTAPTITTAQAYIATTYVRQEAMESARV